MSASSPAATNAYEYHLPKKGKGKLLMALFGPRDCI
jgi:hypothetical protein